MAAGGVSSICFCPPPLTVRSYLRDWKLEELGVATDHDWQWQNGKTFVIFLSLPLSMSLPLCRSVLFPSYSANHFPPLLACAPLWEAINRSTGRTTDRLHSQSCGRTEMTVWSKPLLYTWGLNLGVYRVIKMARDTPKTNSWSSYDVKFETRDPLSVYEVWCALKRRVQSMTNASSSLRAKRLTRQTNETISQSQSVRKSRGQSHVWQELIKVEMLWWVLLWRACLSSKSFHAKSVYTSMSKVNSGC